MKIKNKIYILITFFIHIYSYNLLFSNQPIYLTPIDKSLLYDNFIDSLYPFMYSINIVELDKNSILKLLDEIDYENGFYGDILKVEVIEGYHKGKIGYILEENVCLTYESIKKNVNIFFEKDITIDNRFKINKNTRCSIIDSKLEQGEEILTLKFISTKLNNISIIYREKNNLHFIINKESEILYHLRKNDKIVKVVNSNTLLPIENAICNNTFSDEYGILYIDKKIESSKYLITKEGYSEGIITTLNIYENIYICFLEKLDYINYYHDRETIYQQDFYKFIINSKNKFISKKVGIKVLSKDNFSIFGYPSLEQYDYIIKGGFYIKDLPKFTDTICQINLTDNSLELKYFNIDKLKWDNIIIKKNNGHFTFQLFNDGYYILVSKSNNKQNIVRIKPDENLNISKIFFKDKEGDKYFVINNYQGNNIDAKEILIHEDRYESLFFSIKSPYNLIQKYFYFNLPVNNFKFSDLEIQENEVIKPKGFSSLYNGNWYRKIIKVNDKIINKENKIEFLGDIFLESSNKISFINENYIIEGFIEIIDQNKLYIYILSINIPIVDSYNKQIFYVNPSLFNSQLVIPAYYSFKLGIFQISFNNIYFIRKKIYNDFSDKNIFLILESNIFGNPQFPLSESKSIYKIYFTQ